MNNLAETLEAQGKYEEAERIHRQTLELQENLLGSEHPDTLSSIKNLADALRFQKKYVEAQHLYRTLELRTKVVSVEHPHMLTSVNRLAPVLESQEKGADIWSSNLETAGRSHYAKSAPHTDWFAPSESREGKGISKEHQILPLQDAVTVIDEENKDGEPSDVEPSDGHTDFTGASNMSPQWIAGYVSDFSRRLRDAIPRAYLDGFAMKRLEAVLPELLKEFAIKIGYNPPTYRHYEIIYLVRRNRVGISRQFQEAHAEDGDADSPVGVSLARDDPNTPLDGKMALWGQNTPRPDSDMLLSQVLPPGDDDLSVNGSAESSLDNEGEGSQTDVHDFQEYQDCLVDSAAYEWLLETLKRQVLLAPADPDLRGAIRQGIIRSLPRNRDQVSRKALSGAHQALFQVEWDPASFVKEGMYNASPDEAIATAITITGSAQDAQALTSSQYLSQTWGSLAVLQVVQAVLRRKPGEQYSATLPDTTTLVAWSSGPMFNVSVVGTGPSIADIGEQLAWLGAALRPPPHREQHSGVCTALLQNPLSFREGGGQALKWPLLAGTGLEIPLNAMAKLIRTDRITTFDNQFFIKGFSSMLALMERRGDLFLWHHFYNAKGGRISYLDCSERPSESFTESQLESGRHIVGIPPGLGEPVSSGAATGSLQSQSVKAQSNEMVAEAGGSGIPPGLREPVSSGALTGSLQSQSVEAQSNEMVAEAGQGGGERAPMSRLHPRSLWKRISRRHGNVEEGEPPAGKVEGTRTVGMTIKEKILCGG
ncbi:hypothetical protein QBC46DRAFT_355641 [Diplogelasinospora grovesii]|uniref:Uncharacterized protein n=1 Tax=Diplogelasinospora grovesii TaxID=303347 RepID=A0AAN6N7B3_9PEZI|nr:hypothetical protein QBC46DRAFT_355641 [Diplogelasinospora grovesii]